MTMVSVLLQRIESVGCDTMRAGMAAASSGPMRIGSPNWNPYAPAAIKSSTGVGRVMAWVLG
jgi:hypothetical protein